MRRTCLYGTMEGETPGGESKTPEELEMEYLQSACDRGLYYIMRPGPKCWKCIDGKPVRVDCDGE